MRHRMDVAVVLLSSVPAISLVASSGSVRDETSLVQRQLQGQQLPDAEMFNVQVTSWLDGYYSVIRSKGDEWLIKCCEKSRTYGIDPWNSWGTASEEDQKWWQETNCNAIVGSVEEDIGIGTPNCERGTYDSLLRAHSKQVALHRTEEEGCDDIDRESIDDEYFDRDSIPSPLSIECNSDHLVGGGAVNFTRFAECTKSILKISDTCTACYTNFVKNVAGTPTTPGCFTMCHTLTYCRKRELCSNKLKICAQCAQPALVEYDRCVGGSLHNRLNIDHFLKKMLRFSAH
mmetsp:Transcript_137099/g.426007  ORF Transcript_137099/g.426007 Transcript_137099/m.426007 type:complete len:288 (-) Transcript_137099:335-1198(-)